VDWYIEGGSGMSATLGIADHKQAYTLTDRGTFLSQRSRLDLEILAEGDPLLKNPYAVIVVNREKHPGINYEAARKFAAFLLDPETQTAIARFGVEEYGQPLFFPDAVDAAATGP
jgi:tungstate transport system substrate-binding protein